MPPDPLVAVLMYVCVSPPLPPPPPHKKILYATLYTIKDVLNLNEVVILPSQILCEATKILSSGVKFGDSNHTISSEILCF